MEITINVDTLAQQMKWLSLVISLGAASISFCLLAVAYMTSSLLREDREEIKDLKEEIKDLEEEIEELRSDP